MNGAEFRTWLNGMLPAQFKNKDEIIAAIQRRGSLMHTIFEVGKAYGEHKTRNDFPRVVVR